MKVKMLMAILLLIPVQLHAYCEGGKYPNISVVDEIKECEFIVIGSVISRKIVVDPIEDPDGYEAEIFHVKVESILNGNPKNYEIKPYLSLYNANGSSRFPMKIGEKYLLFVYPGNAGLWVNSCGNSMKYQEGETKITEIEKALKKIIH